MKENSTRKFSKRKILWSVLTPLCSLLVAGGVLTGVLVTEGKHTQTGGTDVVEPNEPQNPTEEQPSDTPTGGQTGGQTGTETDEPVSGTITTFADPLDEMSVLHGYGFYHNTTLNSYYEHRGLDISAEAGDPVYATTDGEITAIYSGDVLMGNQIVLTSADGIVTVYHFVEPSEDLHVGDKAKRGQTIGCVSSATGSEYKDGAHLHVEVLVNGKNTDPENYLASSEK